MRGRVLIVAGSDSGGGAGIQADIKTISMLDAYAATAITALTAQNTEGVFGVLPIPPEFIRLQIEVVLDDIGADVIKTGMLHDAAVIEATEAVLRERAAAIPIVVDPVMVAKGGARVAANKAVLGQLGNYPTALFVAAFLMFLLGAAPGLPVRGGAIIGQ